MKYGEFNTLLEILLVSTIFLLLYKIRLLKYERDQALNKNESHSKILFLQSRYASMGETIGNIAHQWKQPLNAIGSIQNNIKAALIFQGEISKEKLLQSVETSFKLLQHLAETIDTFYSFLTQQTKNSSSFIISDVFETIQKITEYSFENSNIKLLIALHLNPTIKGNANEFTHAMLNLIFNAKEAFNMAQTDFPSITIRVTGNDTTCTITVTDNAGGIHIEPIEKIFDLYITSKENGSGLGLFMSKNIIENRFGGTISVQNNDTGASFSIELPYSEYGEYFSSKETENETLSLERISSLSLKIIELEEAKNTLGKWAEIFKHARWAIAVHLGTSNHLEMSNPMFDRMYGYTQDDRKHINVSDLFAPECTHLLPKMQAEAFDKGYASFEATHLRKDGTRFPVSIELIVVKSERGKVLYHIANIWDITEKKRSEVRLKLKKFALDHSTDAIFLIDKNGRFHYVNEGACRALGYTESELIVMGVEDIDTDWPQKRWDEHWKILKDTGALTVEVRHKRRDGSLFPVEVSANYMEYEGEGYNMVIARNITERKSS